MRVVVLGSTGGTGKEIVGQALERGHDVVALASDLDWTVVRPTALTNGPRTGQYRVSPRLSPPGGYQISRADLAHFVLEVAAGGSWLAGTPTVAY